MILQPVVEPMDRFAALSRQIVTFVTRDAGMCAVMWVVAGTQSTGSPAMYRQICAMHNKQQSLGNRHPLNIYYSSIWQQ